MRLEKPSPYKLIIKSNMLLLWIIGGVFSLPVTFMLIALWIEVQFEVSQEVLFFSFLLLLILYYGISRFRIPTIEATFDLQASNFTLEKKWLWIHSSKITPISEINDIQVIQKGRFGKAKLYYRIEVELVSGEVIALSAGNYRDEEGVRWLAKELRNFLKIERLPENFSTNKNEMLRTAVN